MLSTVTYAYSPRVVGACRQKDHGESLSNLQALGSVGLCLREMREWWQRGRGWGAGILLWPEYIHPCTHVYRTHGARGQTKQEVQP